MVRAPGLVSWLALEDGILEELHVDGDRSGVAGNFFTQLWDLPGFELSEDRGISHLVLDLPSLLAPDRFYIHRRQFVWEELGQRLFSPLDNSVLTKMQVRSR